MPSINNLSSKYFWGGLRAIRTYSHWPIFNKIITFPQIFRLTVMFHLYYNYDFNHSVLKFSTWLKCFSVLIYIISRLVKFLTIGGRFLYPEVLSPSRFSLCLTSPPLVSFYFFNFQPLYLRPKWVLWKLFCDSLVLFSRWHCYLG